VFKFFVSVYTIMQPYARWILYLLVLSGTLKALQEKPKRNSQKFSDGILHPLGLHAFLEVFVMCCASQFTVVVCI